MDIDNLMEATTTSVFYMEGFRAVLEDHMTVLRTHTKTQKITITGTTAGAMDAYRFEYDFFGLLDKYGVAKYLHWVVLRMMDMTSPLDATADLTYFLLPDSDYLSQLAMAYMTTNKIT